MHVTKHNFGLLTQSTVKNDKKLQTTKAFKQQKIVKNMLECKTNKQTTLSRYIERINAWTCYNAYA